MKIKEIIVVEGRDDTAAIKKSVEAVTIETHGYGIMKEVWCLIEKAYEAPGIIVFTDPDHAGEQIRRRILEKCPNAKEAFLDRKAAEKAGDIGIENASPQSIREALSKARCSLENLPGENGDETGMQTFTAEEMIAYGLQGRENSAQRRAKLGKALGIGYANSKGFLQRLNKFGVTREEFLRALQEI